MFIVRDKSVKQDGTAPVIQYGPSIRYGAVPNPLKSPRRIRWLQHPYQPGVFARDFDIYQSLRRNLRRCQHSRGR